MGIKKYIIVFLSLVFAVNFAAVNFAFATVETHPYAAVHGDSVTGQIESDDSIHLAIGSSNAGTSGFVFQGGEAGSISAIADGGGGEITVTAAGHGLSAGEIVSLVGDTGYDELYEVQSVDGNDFNVTAVYSATGTGTYIRGINFTVLSGAEGIYEAGGGFTGNNSTGGATFYFYIVKNTTATIVFGRTFSNSVDTGNAGSEGAIIDLVPGDIVSFGFVNTSSASDIEQDVLNILLKRLAR